MNPGYGHADMSKLKIIGHGNTAIYIYIYIYKYKFIKMSSYSCVRSIKFNHIISTIKSFS